MFAAATKPDRNVVETSAATAYSPRALEISVSTAPCDPDWDGFLLATPGGDHVQTSLWGQLKATLGWNAVRLIARDGGHIVGGAQLLIRDYRKRLRIGYLAKGPIMAHVSEPLAESLIRGVHQLALEYRLHCVIVQPPCGITVGSLLRERAYYPVRLATFLQATTVIDLSQSTEQLLNHMRPKTRKSVRQSQRRGVQVRRGGEDDLPMFFDLLSATSQRQGFGDFSNEYFEQLWKCLSPGGHVQLFIAEAAGKPVSAAIRVAFGDRVICKKRGWSGEFGSQRPNEALEWAAIRWAKRAGYRYYDFEGIPRSTADAVMRGGFLPTDHLRSPAAYKLGFGGEVKLLPETVAYFANPILRWGHRIVPPQVASWPLVERLVARLKVV